MPLKSLFLKAPSTMADFIMTGDSFSCCCLAKIQKVKDLIIPSYPLHNSHTRRLFIITETTVILTKSG